MLTSSVRSGTSIWLLAVATRQDRRRGPTESFLILGLETLDSDFQEILPRTGRPTRAASLPLLFVLFIVLVYKPVTRVSNPKQQPTKQMHTYSWILD